jgi:hypothetical protein
LPSGRALSVYLRERTGALLQPAAGISGGAAGALHDGGCEAGVSYGEELLAELHDQLRASGELYRPLACAADVFGDAGAFGTWGWRGAGADSIEAGLGAWACGDKES